ncbi:MAG: aldo/keto reductase [Isosphaeraceae bacterium]|nr:aldo/keto reductase [Isosphaeraceae bacterium]
MEGSHGPCGGGNRRRFLKTAAAAGAALASTDALRGAPPATQAKAVVPTVTLGKTGQKVTKLGMGTSWALSPSFVQAALFSGVRYIDTSESYENTKAEKVIGEVLDRTGMRKDIYLVTKNSKGHATGDAAVKVYEERLDESLARLKTDYADCYYIHGISTREIDMLRDPGVKAAFEHLKKVNKIRFCGLSCHDPILPEILELAAEVGWIDQVMIKYNYRDVGKKERYDDLNRAIDKASKANIGLVAMKTQSGAEAFPADKAALEAKGIKAPAGGFQPREKAIVDLLEKGYKREVAAIKTVWMDPRMQVVVSEMTNFSDLRENVAASQEPLTTTEMRLLEQYRETTAHLYCHGCGHLCESAAKGVPVATVLRYLRYYEVYGKRQEARALYQALPPVARDLAAADLLAAESACPHGLPVVDLVRRADRQMA